MEKIISELQTLKEDRPHLYLDDNTIRAYIEDNMELLIDEIREQVEVNYPEYDRIDVLLDKEVN